MNYLNAFVSVNKMDKNRILGARYLGFSKYLRIISLVSLISFLIFTAISKGDDILVVVSYILMMLTIITIIQSFVFLFLGKYFLSKVKG